MTKLQSELEALKDIFKKEKDELQKITIAQGRKIEMLEKIVNHKKPVDNKKNTSMQNKSVLKKSKRKHGNHLECKEFDGSF